MSRELTSQVIIITGASSGIGAATAIECAKAGMNCVITARREDKLRQIADRVKELGRRCETVVGDVVDEGMSDRLLDTAESAFGRFDAVFANAGYGMSCKAHNMTDEQWRRMFDVNFFAANDLITAAARRLIDQDRPGHLLMCSSCLSKFALANHSSYAATKAAQNAVCSAMRMELAEKNIYVSSVHPITTTTEFFDASAKMSGITKPNGDAPNHTPGFLVQTPRTVARAIVKCLRRPRPEVWTSFIVRFSAALFTLSPRFGDWALRRQSKRDEV